MQTLLEIFTEVATFQMQTYLNALIFIQNLECENIVMTLSLLQHTTLILPNVLHASSIIHSNESQMSHPLNSRLNKTEPAAMLALCEAVLKHSGVLR